MQLLPTWWLKRQHASVGSTADEQTTGFVDQLCMVVTRGVEKTNCRIDESTGALFTLKELPRGVRKIITAGADTDVRLPAPKAETFSSAEVRLKRVAGRRLSVINRSRELGAVYGMDADLCFGQQSALVPITLVTDTLLRGAHRPESESFAVALHFESAEPTNQAVLVVGYNADGMVAGVSRLTVGVSKPKDAVMASVRQMTAATTGVLRDLPYSPALVASDIRARETEALFFERNILWFTGKQFADAAKAETGFPNEPMLYGFKKRHLRYAAITAAVSVAALSWGVALLAKSLASHASAEAAIIASADDAAQAAQRARLLDTLDRIPLKTSLEPDTLYDAAFHLWKPGTKVSMDASVDQIKLTLWVPTLRPSVVSRGGAVTSTTVDDQKVLDALRAKPPVGFAMDGIETNGEINGFKLTFTGHSADTRWLDLLGLRNSGSRSTAQSVHTGQGQSSSSPSALGATKAPIGK